MTDNADLTLDALVAHEALMKTDLDLQGLLSNWPMRFGSPRGCAG
jgi:hypothetical protein